MQGIMMRPMLILATIEGRKTKTRRVVKPQPLPHLSIGCYYGQGYNPEFVLSDHHGDVVDLPCPQPKYREEEVLYIKEECGYALGHIIYRYHTGPARIGDSTNFHLIKAKEQQGERWHPAKQMPAWAARYFIKVKHITVERLHDIGLIEAKLEGCDSLYPSLQYEFTDDATPEKPTVKPESIGFSPNSFLELWESLHRHDYPWDSNPWVWVYEYEYLKEGL